MQRFKLAGQDDRFDRGEDVDEFLRERLWNNPKQPELKSDPADQAVIRSLSDLMILPSGLVQPQEKAFAADLLIEAIDRAPLRARVQLSSRIAGMAEAPSPLVRRLLRDQEIDVAAPMLEEGLAVNEQDLIDSARRSCACRARIIARRKNLSPAVAAALVDTAYLSVTLDLLRNQTSQISPETIGQLAEKAELEPDLQEPLVSRPEMTPACALHLFWTVSPKLRHYILNRFLADAEQVLAFSVDGADREHREKERLVEKQSRGRTAELFRELTVLLEEHETEPCADVLADMAGISLRTAYNIISDSKGESLIVACKAAAVPRIAFSEACERWHLTGNRAFMSKRRLQVLQALFDELSFSKAKMALTYWNWWFEKTGPYAGSSTRQDQTAMRS